MSLSKNRCAFFSHLFCFAFVGQQSQSRQIAEAHCSERLNLPTKSTQFSRQSKRLCHGAGPTDPRFLCGSGIPAAEQPLNCPFTDAVRQSMLITKHKRRFLRSKFRSSLEMEQHREKHIWSLLVFWSVCHGHGHMHFRMRCASLLSFAAHRPQRLSLFSAPCKQPNNQRWQRIVMMFLAAAEKRMVAQYARARNPRSHAKPQLDRKPTVATVVETSSAAAS